MKKIGFILDKNSKKIFILPEDVKQLNSKNITVYLQANYGKTIGIDDIEYKNAGAQILDKTSDVINNSDVICKPNAFIKNELNLMKNKIAITMANYIANVEMLYHMLRNKIKSYAWCCLTDNNEYVFFPELENIKAKFVSQKIINTMKDRKYIPRILILNATWASHKIIQDLLAHNINVTLLDNDIKYCNSLKNSPEIRKISKEHNTHLDLKDAKFETLSKAFFNHDGFVNTCTDPFSRTKTRITDTMAKSMPPNSILIDESCENGYAFHFQKKFATLDDASQKIGKSNYICVADITELSPKESSQIISKKSAYFLALIAEDKTDSFIDILITKDGNCVNKDINRELNLL